jgi:hypothetical protein
VPSHNSLSKVRRTIPGSRFYASRVLPALCMTLAFAALSAAPFGDLESYARRSFLISSLSCASVDLICDVRHSKAVHLYSIGGMVRNQATTALRSCSVILLTGTWEVSSVTGKAFGVGATRLFLEARGSSGLLLIVQSKPRSLRT